MQIKHANLIIFAAFAIAVTGLFVVKNKVESLSNQVIEINKQISEEKSKIYLLKAEIAYLTSPEVLRHYIANNLGMKTVNLDQIIEDPAEQRTDAPNKNIILVKSNQVEQIKWRFKKSPNRYLQQAAMRK